MTSHRLKWGSFSPNEVIGSHRTSGREKEGNKERAEGSNCPPGRRRRRRRRKGIPRNSWMQEVTGMREKGINNMECVGIKRSANIDTLYIKNNFYSCTEYQCFHMFLCIKFYFPSPFLPVDPFHVINSLLSHSSC